jgi:ring-1,2-phenylacetyl-CoA epoxidase subunit PaaC
MSVSVPIIQPADVAEADNNAALFDYLLRLGDDSLILGQRLAEWCGRAPALEIDLSLANVALDLIGQATLFLDLAGEVEGKGRDGDKLAFHRDAMAFRNCLVVEQPNGDFAQTIARQFLFSTMQLALFEKLSASSNARIAEIAAKAVKEIQYHAELAAEWVIRLGDGTAESRQRMIDGLDWFWRFVDEMFESDAIEQSRIEGGVAVDRSTLRQGFDTTVNNVLREATLPLPTYPRAIKGGRAGRHSEHLGHLLATMQYLPRAHPDAVW